jgi:hypothetical protein
VTGIGPTALDGASGLPLPAKKLAAARVQVRTELSNSQYWPGGTLIARLKVHAWLPPNDGVNSGPIAGVSREGVAVRWIGRDAIRPS